MQENQNAQVSKGGRRPNSGRKPKYGEPSKVLQMRVPESKYGDIKKAISILLTEDWLERFIHEFDN